MFQREGKNNFKKLHSWSESYRNDKARVHIDTSETKQKAIGEIIVVNLFLQPAVLP